MAGRVGLLLGLIAVVFLQHAADATVHIVGDITGWTNALSSPTFYVDWANNQSIVDGDTLQFNFQTNAHDVLKMDTKESFDACSFNTNDNDIKRTSPVTVQLDEPGMHYFVCTIGSHCTQGQRLAINVSATSSGPMPPSTPRSPPSPSSSNGVTASLYVTLLSAIVMSLF